MLKYNGLIKVSRVISSEESRQNLAMTKFFCPQKRCDLNKLTLDQFYTHQILSFYSISSMGKTP